MAIDARKTQHATSSTVSDTSHKLFATCGFNLALSWQTVSKHLVSIACISWLTACTPVQEPAPPEPAPQPAPVVRVLSVEPIQDATKQQMLFAQSALDKLGYNVGPVDGIWGPWSAREIRKFEATHGIESANGFLSESNLDKLSQESGLNIAAFVPTNAIKKDIASKLKGELVDTGPQLIIVERDHDVFIEANPYSERVQTLSAGTGIYVISEKEGWYEVELINRKKGYLQSN